MPKECVLGQRYTHHNKTNKNIRWYLEVGSCTIKKHRTATLQKARQLDYILNNLRLGITSPNYLAEKFKTTNQR